MIRRLSVIPYGRMQFVDVTAGPVERSFGLATVRMHTAAAASDARVPGLPAAEAARLRDNLTALGEARAAGLVTGPDRDADPASDAGGSPLAAAASALPSGPGRRTARRAARPGHQRGPPSRQLHRRPGRARGHRPAAAARFRLLAGHALADRRRCPAHRKRTVATHLSSLPRRSDPSRRHRPARGRPHVRPGRGPGAHGRLDRTARAGSPTSPTTTPTAVRARLLALAHGVAEHAPAPAGAGAHHHPDGPARSPPSC